MAKKKQSASRRSQISWSLLGLVFALILVVICVVVWTIALVFGGMKQTTQPTNLPAVEKSAVTKKPEFQRTLKAYREMHEGKPDIKWWMSTDITPDEADTVLEKQLIAESRHIEKLLKKYRDVSSERHPRGGCLKTKSSTCKNLVNKIY